MKMMMMMIISTIKGLVFAFSRITAAVEKVELLWHKAFSKARLQLQVFQLREDALQVSHLKTIG